MTVPNVTPELESLDNPGQGENTMKFLNTLAQGVRSGGIRLFLFLAVLVGVEVVTGSAQAQSMTNAAAVYTELGTTASNALTLFASAAALAVAATALGLLIWAVRKMRRG